MAYIIGNTTVIDNNAALGAVDGNNLNLGSNNNIPAGGASTGFFTSTTNQTVVGTNLAFVIGTGAGGGGARNNSSFSQSGPAGGGGRTAFSIMDVSAGGNATYTIGAGGNWGYNANAGGASSVTHTTNASFGGGNGGRNQNGAAGTTPTGYGFVGTPLSNTTTGNNIFGNYGRGGNGGRLNVTPQNGFPGFIFTIG